MWHYIWDDPGRSYSTRPLKGSIKAVAIPVLWLNLHLVF